MCPRPMCWTETASGNRLIACDHSRLDTERHRFVFGAVLPRINGSRFGFATRKLIWPAGLHPVR
jgi:hypothetical protein